MPSNKKSKAIIGEIEMNTLSKEDVQKIVAEYLKKRKNTDEINISIVMPRGKEWVVSGTCPIDMGGRLWTERFEVTVDRKGKIKSVDFSLL